MDQNELETAYREFNKNFKQWVPDGIIQIDLETLCDMGLVSIQDADRGKPEDVTQYFHVLETPDKITLHNEKFAVWIVPKMIDNLPTTHTYISQMEKNKPHLEIVYSTEGVYNSPKFILKVLQHLLIDMLDTDAFITSMIKKKEDAE